MTKKRVMDLRVEQVERLGAAGSAQSSAARQSVLLSLTSAEGELPECRPGQFVQLRIDAPGVFLRRPISIHDVDGCRLDLMVQVVGDGTRWLAELKPGDVVNTILPLGNGFYTTGLTAGDTVLLVGGGVGVAPLLYLGKRLRAQGVNPLFLLGGRSSDYLLCLETFREVGEVEVTTEDGSMGERGFVTQHSLFRTLTSGESGAVKTIFVCGPTPMMKAVAGEAERCGIPCQVSLENRMACGVGACLCCVQDTVEGHRCVCTDGPVFRSEMVKW